MSAPATPPNGSDSGADSGADRTATGSAAGSAAGSVAGSAAGSVADSVADSAAGSGPGAGSSTIASAFRPGTGLHLIRTDESVNEIAALKHMLGGSVGLGGVLADLNRQGRRSFGWFGRAARTTLTWDAFDRRTPRWFPQGITTADDANLDSAGLSQDAADPELLVVTWYAKEVGGLSHGSRVTFYDVKTRRYRHVLLVQVTLVDPGDPHSALRLDPVTIHAGGVVWAGDYLHIAATARGLVSCLVEDIIKVPLTKKSAREDELLADEDQVAAFGYSYLLPVRFTYQARTDRGQAALRYSFLSLDRHGPRPQLVCGEYGRGEQTTRLARIPLSADTLLPDVDGPPGSVSPASVNPGPVSPGPVSPGPVSPGPASPGPASPGGAGPGGGRQILLSDAGVPGMQGVAVVGDNYYITVSHGTRVPGTLYAGTLRAGTPGALKPVRFAVPPGPEDISYSPKSDTLWTLTEHPRRRWLVGMKRSWFNARR